jgi:hypothetical protein
MANLWLFSSTTQISVAWWSFELLPEWRELASRTLGFCCWDGTNILHSKQASNLGCSWGGLVPHGSVISRDSIQSILQSYLRYSSAGVSARSWCCAFMKHWGCLGQCNTGRESVLGSPGMTFFALPHWILRVGYRKWPRRRGGWLFTLVKCQPSWRGTKK